jgi:hypothetical protein
MSMTKTAARRGLEIIRQAIKRGVPFREAESMAQRFVASGAIKSSGPGSQIKHLGAGAEGVATLVAGAKSSPKGLSVRKAYYRDGLFSSKDILARKTEMQRRLRNDPNFARLYSPGLERGLRGSRYTINEFAYPPQSNLSALRPTPEMLSPVRNGRPTVGKGLGLADVRDANMVHTKDGPKVVDFLPKSVKDFSPGSRSITELSNRANNNASMKRLNDQLSGRRLSGRESPVVHQFRNRQKATERYRSQYFGAKYSPSGMGSGYQSPTMRSALGGL